MRPDKKPEPLYRKVNTRTHGVHHGGGGDYGKDRNTKREKRSEALTGSMHAGKRNGLDYTPLFRFLLSRVGHDWGEVYRGTASRLDCEEPIFWMVARRPEEYESYFRAGESSYFSKLYVDDQNKLALVDPDLSLEDMVPSCPCCTHTFNGKRFVKPYSDGPERSE